MGRKDKYVIKVKNKVSQLYFYITTDEYNSVKFTSKLNIARKFSGKNIETFCRNVKLPLHWDWVNRSIISYENVLINELKK